MERVVQRTEHHDKQSDDKSGLKQGEYNSKQFVDPTEHHEIDEPLKQFSYEGQSCEHCNHDDGE